MFTHASMRNLIICTIVFLIAAGYIHRYQDEHEIPMGMTRLTLFEETTLD